TLTLASGDSNTNSLLDVGETWSYSATKAVTQEMLNAGGDLVNIAKIGRAAGREEAEDSTVHLSQSKKLDNDKEGTVDEGTDDVITYSYTVTNTGNAAISHVVVVDDNATPGVPGDDLTLTLASGDSNTNSLLDVGETWSYSATKAVTQAMLNAGGDLVNIA